MSNKIKVLFITYPRIGLNRGGLQIQIEKTAEALTNAGVEVIFCNPWKNQIPDVDLCHVFSIDGTLVYHVERAVGLGKPVIISPVFNGFTDGVWKFIVKAKLAKYIPGMYSDLKRAGSMLSLSNLILALNEAERDSLVRAFRLPSKNCVVLPNGIDHRFCSADPALFESKFGVKDFILQVGSIEPNKNQLNTIRAVVKLPYKLVIIGQATPANQGYFAKCRAAAGGNVIFAGQFAHEDPLFVSAFAAAKIFVLPSYREVMPLALYEAAVAGAKLAISKNVPISDDIKQFVPIFDPDNTEEIAAVIDNEMKIPRKVALQEKARLMPTWQDIGCEIRAIYDNVLMTNTLTKPNEISGKKG